MSETTWTKSLWYYEEKYSGLKKNTTLSEKQIATILISEE